MYSLDNYEMNEKKLLARIKRLEDALVGQGKPTADYTCECCGRLYIPNFYDSVRCDICCQSCKFDSKLKIWIKGFLCPCMKDIQY